MAATRPMLANRPSLVDLLSRTGLIAVRTNRRTTSRPGISHRGCRPYRSGTRSCSATTTTIAAATGNRFSGLVARSHAGTWMSACSMRASRWDNCSRPWLSGCAPPPADPISIPSVGHQADKTPRLRRSTETLTLTDGASGATRTTSNSTVRVFATATVSWLGPSQLGLAGREQHPMREDQPDHHQPTPRLAQGQPHGVTPLRTPAPQSRGPSVHLGGAPSPRPGCSGGRWQDRRYSCRRSWSAFRRRPDRHHTGSPRA